jgi:hypothetical protein
MPSRTLLNLTLAVVVAVPLGVPAAAATTGAATAAETTPAAGAGVSPEVRLTEAPLVVPPAADVRARLATEDELAAEEPVDPAADAPVVADAVSDERGADRVVTPPVSTEDVQTVGVTWPEGAQVDELAPQVRSLQDGTWSDWVDLEAGDAAPDAGTTDAEHAVRGGTDSVWIGDAEAVQVSFAATVAGGPADLTLALVGSDEETAAASAADDAATGSPAAQDAVLEDAVVRGTSTGTSAVFNAAAFRSAAPADGVAAAAATTAVPAAGVMPAGIYTPRVISRPEWGARAQVCAPDVARTVTAAVVHHTAGSNAYASPAQAMQQIRNDQAYHIDGRGWCDIGYNFLVDKWGNIYEGRANSGTQPIIGVHAGGFNTSTVGISMLGDYSSITPSAATQEAVAQVIAWRLGTYYRDPASTVSYTTGGGENSRYPAGTTLALPTVLGHRDVAFTACPGIGGYSTLGWLRARARQIIDTGWVNPVLSATTVAPGGSVSIMGGTLGPTSATLTVTDERTGMVLSSTSAVVNTPGGAIMTWNGRGPTGAAVGPGTYRLTLSGSGTATGAAAAPWGASVTVQAGANPPTVAPVPLGSDLTFVPLATPQRVIDTRLTGQSLGPAGRIDVTVAGAAGVPADAKAVALNVTAVAPSAITFVRAWPAGGQTPDASVLNTDPTRTTGAGVMVGVGGEGKVSLYNNAGTTHLVVDVFGYYTDEPGAGYGYTPLDAGARVLDTRSDGSRMSAGQRRTVQVSGQQGVPADARAVLVNVSSVTPFGLGNVSAFPSGGTVPVTASVNHMPAQNVSNRTVVPLDASGRLDLVVQGAAVDVVLDVIGWYGPSGQLTFTPVLPARAFDTRADNSGLETRQTREYSLAAAGLPAEAQVAVLSVAATRQSAPFTFLTAWQTGTSRPAASDLNTGAGRDQANSTAVPVDGADPRVQVYNDAGHADVVVDVLGYFG